MKQTALASLTQENDVAGSEFVIQWMITHSILTLLLRLRLAFLKT
jgi:hypothetical protein